ncbi:MAG: type II toxin-antitoxin system VapC family toxin [Blastocatellia bacterium]
MDIDFLPSGARALIDANIFIYYLGGASAECRDFLRRVARNEVEAHLTTTIIAEVLHRRMMAEAITKGLISPGQPLKKLKANPAVITTLTDYITEIEKLLRLPLRVTEVTAADIAASHDLHRQYGLFVNDSINLACAVRLGLADIVTHDADFNRVPNIRVWEPTDT